MKKYWLYAGFACAVLGAYDISDGYGFDSTNSQKQVNAEHTQAVDASSGQNYKEVFNPYEPHWEQRQQSLAQEQEIELWQQKADEIIAQALTRAKHADTSFDGSLSAVNLTDEQTQLVARTHRKIADIENGLAELEASYE